MDAKNQSHWWWFDSHNTKNCSPWLESTLAELNEKTKTMLMLVEDDADSFAKRAEMYYKKRPELISMVEDFYRAHRSLAERYDQLKSDRSIRVKSPLRHLLSLPKDDYENGFDSAISVKSYDSFTYSSDESAESEVDDPEFDDDSEVDQVEDPKENPITAWVGNDEMTKLREELDRLREENEIQKSQINISNKEKEELRAKFEAIKEEKKTEMSKLEDEMLSLRLESVKQRELVNQKDEERIEVAKMKLEEENRYLKDKLKHEEEEKIIVTRLFEEAKIELVKLKEEQLNHEEEEKVEAKRKLEEMTKELIELREETQKKDGYLIEALAEKDEEKRAVIRQLSLAMEILREDNKLLEKATAKDASKKRSPSQFQMFKGVQLSKLFSPSPRCCYASVVPLKTMRKY
ncbi:uncharacterized protein LOC141591774 [Silene latifolia]|uniref:uncharacterized protein LOC141591774 n=1 Tax=Silene latifolia TaxID=37657 RepID=UPI003D780BD4